MLSNSCYLKLFQLETEMFSSRPFLFQSKKLKQNPMCKNVIVYDGNLPKAIFRYCEICSFIG